MRDLLLDFESFFGSVPVPGEFTGVRKKRQKMFNLSLKNPKLSYTDYVRHPDFEVLGVSLKWADEDGDPEFIRGPDVARRFRSIDWANTRVVCHNALFDGLILYETYGIVPAAYFCTLAAAESIYQGATSVGLDNLAKLFGIKGKTAALQDFKGLRVSDLDDDQWSKLAAYANNDTAILATLYGILYKGVPEAERLLMSHTIMLFCNPKMIIDVKMAQEALDDAIKERDDLVARTGYTKEEISGNISFEKALRDELGWVPTKLNAKKEVKQAFAKTDLEFVQLKSHPNEKVRDLVLARMEVKSGLGITRAQRLVTLGTTGTCMANICLHYGRAHTLRWTGGNKMNPQNFTRGSKLRLALRAPDGHMLVVVDSSQIEPRCLAVLAGQQDLVDIFASGGDPYAIMAGEIYGFDIDKAIHIIERFMGKTAVLGLGYGMGWKKFWNEIRTGARGKAVNITAKFAQHVVNVYRTKNDRIMAFHDEAEDWLWYMLDENAPPRTLKNGLITLDPATKRVIFPNGCYLRYPGLENDEGDLKYKVWDVKTKRYIWKKIYGGMFVENLVQAIARHVVADQILVIASKYDCVLFVHDECVYCVPEHLAEEALAFGLEAFRVPPAWFPYFLPLDADGGYAVSYSK